jgi:hypothetical protein
VRGAKFRKPLLDDLRAKGDIGGFELTRNSPILEPRKHDPLLSYGKTQLRAWEQPTI